MLVYAQKLTSRLQYITDFIGKQIIGEPFQLTTDSVYFSEYEGPKINYGYEETFANELLIINYPLLFEDSITEQKISSFNVNGFKAFFGSEGDYPFDIFAASFYLLSRYEEYLPNEKDIYGRYDHENSLAFKEDFLHQPLVNIWIEDFKKVLKERFPRLKFQSSSFSFQPTYDIDEAYATRNKELTRNLGGIARSLASGQWSVISQRIKVLLGKEKDPYDAYEWMDNLHDKYGLNPIYFIHCAIEKGRYDKNIKPSLPDMQRLIKRCAEKYDVGIHPSWKSNDDKSFLNKEIKVLESTTGTPVTSSRQHYIRFTLPHTFRRLIAEGITDEYSMGYGSINGFRASVATPFYWYDLKKELRTNLLLHPYCFMEANSFYEQHYLPQRAYEEMMYYYHAVKAVNGTLVTIWHNHFLGTYPLFQGWKEVYEEFIANIAR